MIGQARLESKVGISVRSAIITTLEAGGVILSRIWDHRIASYLSNQQRPWPLAHHSGFER